MDPATANKLWDEAAKAFSDNDNNLAAEKLEALLQGVGKSNVGPIEQLRFSLGLAYLNSNKFTEAQKAFKDCLAQFPPGKGEYASRCLLGIGKALYATGTDESKNEAIAPLQRAALDPKYRSEAGQTLGQIFTDLHKDDEALKVFRSLMGSEVRTPQQTIAAVEVISLLAESGKLDDLVAYLDRLIRQPGVRDALAWYTNQVIVAADEIYGSGNHYEAALTIYRTILPRNQILSIQRDSLEGLRAEVKRLEARVAADEKLPVSQRSNANELLGSLKSAVAGTEKALKWVEEKVDLDAYMLMARGRSLYYLDRYEEALLCFRTIRTKYPKATDGESAAYAELAILQKLKRTAELGVLSDKFVAAHPESPKSEEVLNIRADAYVDVPDWKKAYESYAELGKKFPNSSHLEKYYFMEASGLMQDGQFSDGAIKFGQEIAKFPSGEYTEAAYYRIALCYFLNNDYKNTLAACKTYLEKYPNGQFAGDILYRLCFIDFQDKTTNKGNQILETLGGYVDKHPDDIAASFMYVLIGDTWAQKKTDKDPDAGGDAQAMALLYYTKAINAKEQNLEGQRYALDAANSILETKKDWKAMGELNGQFLKDHPDSKLAMTCVAKVAEAMIRQKEPQKAAEYIGAALTNRISDPASEEAEMVIDTLLRAIIPIIKKPTPEQVDDVEKNVTAELEKIIGTRTNPTTNARLYYAKAQVRQKFKDYDRANLYIKGIATTTAPEALSPLLLNLCAELLMKEGELDKAQAMFQRLKDKYQESAYSDAGPVGLGRVAVARKQFPEAIKILDDALNNNPGSSMIYEAMLAKINALAGLDKFEDGEALALKVMGDKQAGKRNIALAYMELADLLRKRADKGAVGEAKKQSLLDANARYERVMTAYAAFPDLCAQAYWGSYEVLTQLDRNTDALNVLRQLITLQKLEKTPQFQKAKSIVSK